jgi:hypothetical protein
MSVVHPLPQGANDPLSGWSTKLIWTECVHISGEDHYLKHFLLVIGRFFDADGKNSSMSYAQICADCSIGIDKAKDCARAARDHWLAIGVQQGAPTAHGRMNLYHAMVPPSILDKLRKRESARHLARAKSAIAPARPVQRPSFRVVTGNPLDSTWGQS